MVSRNISVHNNKKLTAKVYDAAKIEVVAGAIFIIKNIKEIEKEYFAEMSIIYIHKKHWHKEMVTINDGELMGRQKTCLIHKQVMSMAFYLEYLNE